MAETTRASRDLHIHNVRLHSLGNKESGTLSLTAHHLTFTFVPGSQAEVRNGLSKAHTSTATTEESTALQDSATRPAEVSGSSKAVNVSHGSNKLRTKTIWVAYSMINSCVLRPSHSPATVHKSQHGRSSELGSTDGDELFPPIYGTGAYSRPSTDSGHLAPYSSPRRPASPAAESKDVAIFEDNIRSPAIRIRCRDFRMMAFHFHGPTADGHTPDESARQVFFTLRDRCCVDKVHDMHAFHFHPPPEERAAELPPYDPRREYSRMGIGGKAAEGPGSAWRITEINHDYSFSATYPSVLCVPRSVSDNMLKYGGEFRSRARIPALAYLHFNGGSITRSSQPLVGMQGKRNPQDERLVSAIFSSHTPPLLSPEDSPEQLPSLTSPSTATLESSSSDAAPLDSDAPGLPLSHSDTALDEKGAENTTTVRRRVYGSTRRNYIVDARPKINAIANRATGGGMEDISNYLGAGEVPVDKVFLSIQNIHVMRASLEKVIESMINSDYTKMSPDHELLRKSGWLGHIAGLLDGSALVARAVGLSGSHVLIHCSDGWDRTSQVSALAQIMLDPFYRTLDGFITLVQKDFLSFGHKFRDRNGILGSEKWFEIENERITPSKSGENGSSDSGSLNVFSSKALSGAKNWFEKNRTNLFRQQNASHDSLPETLQPSSPPPNPIIHSPPSANDADKKQHKTSTKEISPVFHQFLEATYQLQRQYPHAFEFNERFLLRLLYHTYASQYGEFLFNNEQERMQHKDKVPSVWSFFLARRAEFINPHYAPKDHEMLLLPKRGPDGQAKVRWWYRLFGRSDEEMNLPRALAPADPPSLNMQPSSVSSMSLDDGAVVGAENGGTAAGETLLRGVKSTPNFPQVKEGMTANMSSLSMSPSGKQTPAESTLTPQRPIVMEKETDFEVLPKNTASASGSEQCELEKEAAHEPSLRFEEGGDPLGVTGTFAQKPAVGGVDFAAFASQNAFSDR